MKDNNSRVVPAESPQRSGESYRQLFDKLNLGMAVCEIVLDEAGDPSDYILVECNPAFDDQSGLEAASVVGHRISEFLPASEIVPIIQRFGAVALSGQSDNFDAFVAKLGRHFTLNVSPIEGLRIAVIFEDVTERTEIANAQSKQTAQMRAFVEQSPAALAMFDRDLRYIAASKRWMTDYGLEDTPVSGRCHYDVFPEIGESWKEVHRRCLAGDTVRCEEDSLVRENGETTWLRWEVTPWRTDNGIGGIMMLTENISARKQAEEAVLEHERLLAESQRIAKIGSWLLYLNGEMVWSEETYRIYGVDPDTFIPTDKSYFKLIHPDDRAAVKTWFRECIAGEPTREVDVRIPQPDGTYHYGRGRGELVRDASGNPAHMVGTIQDITERKHYLEELAQAQKMESIGNLAGGVAHDFNNLLSIIIGHTEMAINAPLNSEEWKSDLNNVLEASNRAAALTRQLLAFSRRQVLEPAALDLNLVIGACANMLRRLVGEDVTFELHPGEDLWPVLADSGQIDQVIMNLVVNARDAMPTGGRLTIEISNVSTQDTMRLDHGDMQSGDFVCVAVSDTGTGMDKQTQEKIFEPFFTTKGQGSGTGLGLATVYGIVKQSGGSIFVYSEIGQGSTFKFYLPRATGIGRGRVTLERNFDQDREARKTILIVEDEKELLALAERVLRGAGYTVYSAINGAAALELAESQDVNFDLLLTDVIMPDMSGYELANTIKERYGRKQVLYMSGYTDRVIAARGVLDEGVHLLTKPFTTGQLKDKVRDILDTVRN